MRFVGFKSKMRFVGFKSKINESILFAKYTGFFVGQFDSIFEVHFDSIFMSKFWETRQSERKWVKIRAPVEACIFCLYSVRN